MAWSRGNPALRECRMRLGTLLCASGTPPRLGTSAGRAEPLQSGGARLLLSQSHHGHSPPGSPQDVSHSAELSHHLCLCDLFSASLCCILMVSECKCPSHRTRSGRHLPVTGHRAGTCPHPQDALQCDLQRHPPLEFCGAWFRGHADVGREL